MICLLNIIIPIIKTLGLNQLKQGNQQQEQEAMYKGLILSVKWSPGFW